MLEKRKLTSHPERCDVNKPVEAALDSALHGARGFAMQERRRLIRSIVESQAQCNVGDLARRFDVSAVTIRSDLAALADSGALVRVHGGALPPGDGEEVPINIKQTLYHAEKVRIAAAAAGLIQDGETVILDSGTTTAEIARQIRGLKLRRRSTTAIRTRRKPR